MSPVSVGVISDTHGQLRPEAIEALRGVDLIVHAGDIGPARIVESLEAVAPVYAVRGNTDMDGWARQLPLTRRVQAGSVTLYVLHNLAHLDLVPHDAGIAVVVSGHSHAPHEQWRDGVLYFNPGSAGPKRFDLPVSVGRLQIDGETIRARHVML